MVQELDNEGNLLENAETISNRLDDVRSRFKILVEILLYNYDYWVPNLNLTLMFVFVVNKF